MIKGLKGDLQCLLAGVSVASTSVQSTNVAAQFKNKGHY